MASQTFVASNGDIYELQYTADHFGARVLRTRSDTKEQEDLYGLISPTLAKRYFDGFRIMKYTKGDKPTLRPRQGFASMSAEKRRDIARRGGLAAHAKGTAHTFTQEEARRAGKLGGQRRRMRGGETDGNS